MPAPRSLAQRLIRRLHLLFDLALAGSFLFFLASLATRMPDELRTHVRRTVLDALGRMIG